MTMSAIEWEQALPELRVRLLRRARRLGTDVTTAEDLVQDTLSEAWRLRDRIYDPAGVDRWASAILTNVHRRWLRQKARDVSPRGSGASQLAGDGLGTDDRASDSFDVEVELERHELAALLDRAMGLLPEETRHVLVQRFVEEAPIGELASRLGLSPGAVRMRLQRGKLALRELLTTTYRDDALAYGLITDAETGWRATKIWCPYCGVARLQGRFCEHGGRLEMACPLGCEINISADDVIYGGVTGFRPALKRTLAYSHEFFRDRLWGPGGPHPVTVQTGPTPAGGHEVWIDGHHHWPRISTTLSGQGLSGPEGRRFWQSHPRIKMATYRELEAEGEPAVLVSFTSAANAAQLDIVVGRQSLRVIRTRLQ
jgi:RNA polymerase sigma-70 factor (ECF subfamily)